MDGFKEGIYQFLHNGSRLRTDAILPLVEKLEELKATLSTLDTYRFYTSSLLLSYEGLDPELHGDAEEQQMMIGEEDEVTKCVVVAGDQNKREKIRITIPVSKSADFQQQPYPNKGNSLDGKLFEKMATTTTADASSFTTPTSYSADNISSLAAATTTSTATGVLTGSEQINGGEAVAEANNSKKSAPTAHCLPSESVAVSIIDFAHATHASMGYYAKEHLGPDSGYIFGISNLIKVLREIHEEETST